MPSIEPLESRVDVLIIGAGPTGLMCANALTMVGANVRIIDKRPAKVAVGHADGILPRMIEVLQSYGLAERLLREGNHMYMIAFYNPGRDGGIECTTRVCTVSQPTNLRHAFGITIHQGVVEDIFINSMKAYGVGVERPSRLADITISEDVAELSDSSSYPVKVEVEQLDAVGESKTEVIHAKFVVGTDGAHSQVRKALGIRMEGGQTDDIWGVLDIVPETNFPDIRNIVIVHSENGSGIIIPREGDKVRFYMQLSDKDIVDLSTGRVDKSRVTPQKILAVARKILHPFELADPKEIEWWTVYIIGQHLASSYSIKDRIFIAGDACHTHSPKAGQGMNAGMSDAHNLAWKLAQVLRGWSSPSLLKTYEEERRKFAQDLISFDKEYAALVSGKPRTPEKEDGVTHEEFFQMFRASGDFINGSGIRYSPSAIVNPKHQKCANNLVVGQSIPAQIFVRAADARPVDILDLLPADVRFKVLFFVGHVTKARAAELEQLANELTKPSSFLHKYNGDGHVSTVFDIITITTGNKGDIDYLLIPTLFRPHWSKILLDDVDVTGSQGGYAYERYGIDPERITLVVIRPDGYVGMIAPSTAIPDLDAYFGSFLLSRDFDS